MLKRMLKASSLGVMFVAGVSACANVEPSAKSVHQNGMTADEYAAAYQIAAARCDRQTEGCSSYSTRDQCIEAKLEASAAETRLRRCSDPVDRSKVQSCVAEIKLGQCGRGISKLEACDKSELCPYVTEEGLM
jgi:hypothetical protein